MKKSVGRPRKLKGGKIQIKNTMLFSVYDEFKLPYSIPVNSNL